VGPSFYEEAEGRRGTIRHQVQGGNGKEKAKHHVTEGYRRGPREPCVTRSIYGIYAIRPTGPLGALTYESATVARTSSGWNAAFYYDAQGGKPVQEFLDNLEKTDPDQADTVYRKFEIFAERGWDDSVGSGPLKHVEGKIFEIKLKGGGQARILGFAWRRLFIAAAAEIKKTDDLDPNTIRVAEERHKDWLERFGS